jgi:integrase
MLAAEEPLVWVSQQLGHSDIITTARRYVRFMPDAHENAGLKAVKKWAT